MKHISINFYITTLLLFGLFSCSSSSKNTEISAGSDDSTLATSDSQIRSFDEPPNYLANYSLYTSGRFHVIIKNLDNKSTVFEHDYFQMADNSKADHSGSIPPYFFWLDDHQILMVFWRNYTLLNLAYSLWSIIDINKSSHGDILIRTGQPSDTTYCSQPLPWYNHSLLATMTIKGKNKAIVFNGQFKTEYATYIASDDPNQEYIYGEKTIPISYSDYIMYKSFPNLVTRSSIDGTDKWKASLSIPYQNVIRNLKDYKLKLVNATVDKTTLQFKTEGLTNAGNDTTVIFKLNLETGETL